MRFVALLLLVVLIVTAADARDRTKTTQQPSPTSPIYCRGRPTDQVCYGGRDRGFPGTDCERNANNNMWYYHRSTRSCDVMRYRGCGGNGNRFCSKVDCENMCSR